MLSAPGPFAPAKMWDKNCKPACFCGMINSKPFSRRRRDFRFCAKKIAMPLGMVVSSGFTARWAASHCR